jgi:hypothetical protein
MHVLADMTGRAGPGGNSVALWRNVVLCPAVFVGFFTALRLITALYPAAPVRMLLTVRG